MKFSIIIPTYNRAKDLVKAVESVKAQTFSDWELIIVDDESTDGTAEAIKPFLTDARIKYMCQEKRGGVAGARNRGAKEAQGEYLAFLDSDDQWTAEKLAKQAELLNKTGGNILIYTNIKYIDTEGKALGELFGQKTTPREGRVLDELLKDNFVTTSSVVLPRQLFLASGGFDQKLNLKVGEDYELWLRLAGKIDFKFLPEPLVRYQVHSEQTTKKRFRVYRNLIKLYWRLIIHTDSYNGLTRSAVARSLAYRIKKVIFHFA